MIQKIKSILQNSFYQLLVVYTLLIIIISLGYLSKYTLHFEIFAVILAVFGIFIINKNFQITYSAPNSLQKSYNIINKKKYRYLFYGLFALAIIFIILFRIIPYFGNSIPLGYDTGIYKYGIEYGLINLDKWVLSGGMEPGFLYLMEPLKLIFSSQFILTYGLIGFCLLLGLSVYFVTKEFFGKRTALIAILIYSLSSIQLLTFSYMYYKNIIALSLALFSIYFLKKSEDNGGNKKNKWFIFLFILFGGLTGAIHRPTFYIFGLSYFIYAFVNPFFNNNLNIDMNNSQSASHKLSSYRLPDIKKKSIWVSKVSKIMWNVFYGILILLIAGVFYLGQFRQAILIMIEPVLSGFVQTGESPGTFINFFTYQFSTLAYLPFAILGFFALFKRKQFNILFFWALITAIIVYFQFFFFNRFIIHLDIMLIILASLGFSGIIENKKKLGIVILILMILSAGFVTFNEARDSKPLINENELNTIQYLNNTEPGAFVMSTSSIYSPWILGYSDRKTIAPGLFDYSIHNKDEWMNFWTTNNINEIKTFLNVYEKPLYIFIGQKQKDNLNQFNESGCFETYYQDSNLNNKIYKYIC